MRGVLVIAALVAALLAACGSSGTNALAPDVQKTVDTAAIDQIEVTWHKAASAKDLDLMMSLWAENATFAVGATLTYAGKADIRNFFATKVASFRPENNWVSETPAYKVRITVDGDSGTLYFECHYVDVATRTVKSVVGSNITVARINGHWLITQARAATAILSP